MIESRCVVALPCRFCCPRVRFGKILSHSGGSAGFHLQLHIHITFSIPVFSFSHHDGASTLSIVVRALLRLHCVLLRSRNIMEDPMNGTYEPPSCEDSTAIDFLSLHLALFCFVPFQSSYYFVPVCCVVPFCGPSKCHVSLCGHRSVPFRSVPSHPIPFHSVSSIWSS